MITYIYFDGSMLNICNNFIEILHMQCFFAKGMLSPCQTAWSGNV